jgi:hypothetical protein
MAGSPRRVSIRRPPALLAVALFALCLGGLPGCSAADGTEIQESSQLPQVVFGGGGGVMRIDVELNQPAELKASFERWSGPDTSDLLSSSQALDPGSHHFEIDVADATYGYLEVGIPEAQVGARIVWTLSLDGRRLDREEVELEQPLRPGHTFTVEFEFDEVADLRQYAKR